MKPASHSLLLAIFVSLVSPTMYGRSLCTPCPSAPSSCRQIPDKILQLKTCLDTQFEETKRIIDMLELCDQSTPISQNDLVGNVFTISSPGVYCLVSDIAGRITINADNVVLNLNNHIISTTGLAPSPQRLILVEGTAQEPRSHITVKNGILRVEEPGQGANLNSNIGLLVEFCTNLTIQDVSFEGNGSEFTAGALLRGASGFFIEQCSFSGMGTNNIQGFGLRVGALITCNNGKISCCEVQNNRSGIVIEATSSSIILDTVTSSDNFLDGLVTQNNVTNCSCIHCNFDRNNRTGYLSALDCMDIDLFDCQAIQNGTAGFVLEGNKFVFDSCRSFNNGNNGFVNNPSTNSCIRNCIAKENGINGFNISGNTNYLFQNIAISNVNNGFNNIGTDNVFFSNYAEGNPAANYSGIAPTIGFTISTGTFVTQPTAWDNIDATP